MIIVTGAAGFIGSCLVSKLNSLGVFNIVIVDDFSNGEKNKNINGKKYTEKVERTQFFAWWQLNKTPIEFVFHLGARTDTTEFDVSIFNELNLNYSKKIWEYCTQKNVPLVYASSAATYGLGEFGYNDDHSIVDKLRPLNPYGESKNDFDKWVLKQVDAPPFWAGLKFFNVYGPNEYHKSRMASVVLHTFKQIEVTGKMRLFRSHNSKFSDGEQLRDFVYVKDVVNVCVFFLTNRTQSGLYNLGTGKARTFLDLVHNTFKALGKKSNIEFVDTPMDIRDKYQYFTEANMSKLRTIGYDTPFTSLEVGVKDYVQNYLKDGKYY